MSERDSFNIPGGCWCPQEWSLYKLRLEGHSADCTAARLGWEMNHRHLGEIDRRRCENEAMGAALRDAAIAALSLDLGEHG